jgi:hypothetical protein
MRGTIQEPVKPIKKVENFDSDDSDQEVQSGKDVDLNKGTIKAGDTALSAKPAVAVETKPQLAQAYTLNSNLGDSKSS